MKGKDKKEPEGVEMTPDEFLAACARQRRGEIFISVVARKPGTNSTWIVTMHDPLPRQLKLERACVDEREWWY